jgi:hypothetical protein
VKCKCPLCRHDQPLPLADRSSADAAKRLRLIPQSADLMRMIKRNEQLEQALLQNHRVACAFDSACVSAAARWCDQCDAEMCEPHDAAMHAGTFALHRRLPLSEKVAARQEAMASKRAAAGAQLKEAARAAVQRLQRAISRQQADVDDGQRDSAEAQQQQQLSQLQKQLKEVEAAATRISVMSDTGAVTRDRPRSAAPAAAARRARRRCRQP